MAMEFGKLNFAVGFNRTSAFPLDANSYFEELTAAETAAAGAAEVGSSDSAYYIGQILIVKDATKGVGLYQIGADKTLVKFGQASSADELTSDLKTLKARFEKLVAGLPVTEGTDGSFTLLEPSESIPLGFFSKAEKDKLAGIEAGAEVNKVASIKVDGVEVKPVAKVVDVAIAGKYDSNGSIVKSETGTAITGTISPITTIDGTGDLPSWNEGSFTANTPTAIDTTKFNKGSCVFPTLTGASIATKPVSQFATAGLTASVDAEETLVFVDAATASAVTDVTIDGGKLNGGSYTAPSLEDGFYTAGTAAQYEEGTLNPGSLPTTKNVTPTFTGDKFGFQGSEITAHKAE